MIEIPPSELTNTSLEAVLEEFITREGTDYGAVEFSLKAKINQLKQQVLDGGAVIVFDPVLSSTHIVSTDAWQASQQAQEGGHED
ncbi:YheU family protein [uncultured Umboniibacter sp.]|uniref:YheU family protein n=1 Tax=uncultured Umboniibacter sp. TaxID=1798917 RepID=UPI002618CBB3|nr:YheU family protein [uncultured Umboniibacter sp.]